MERVDTLSSILLSITILAMGILADHDCIKNMENSKNNYFLIPNICICLVHTFLVCYKNTHVFSRHIISAETLLVNLTILFLDHVFTALLIVTHYRRYNIKYINVKTVSMVVLAIYNIVCAIILLFFRAIS